MEEICADNVEGLLEQFLQYEQQALIDVTHEKSSTSILSSQLTQPPSESVLAAAIHTPSTASCATAHSTTTRKSKDPYCKKSPRKRQIQCEFSATAKHSTETGTPPKKSSVRVSAPTLAKLLSDSRPASTAIPMRSPTNSVPANGGTGHGGVKGTRRTVGGSQYSSEGKDLKRPDVGPAGGSKCVSIESSVPRSKPKTREELIERQQARRTLFLGNLLPTTTESDIVTHFSTFGKIEDVEQFSKRNGNVWSHYAFLTYENKSDADRAINEGFLPDVPNLKLSYGGRRHFCGQPYFDHGSPFFVLQATRAGVKTWEGG